MRGDTGASLDEVLAGLGRSLVEAQRQLDDHTIERIERWDETGIPPSGFAWCRLALCLPVRLRMAGDERPRLRMAAAEESRARLRLRIGYVPADPDVERPAGPPRDGDAGGRDEHLEATCAS